MHPSLHPRTITDNGTNRFGCWGGLGLVEGVFEWAEDIAHWWYAIVGKE